MSGPRLGKVISNDLRRNRRHFVLSSIGVVVGIAAFAFFLALGSGVRTVVLGEIFPLDQIEVIPRAMEVDVGPIRVDKGPDALDDEAVAALEAIEGVSGVYPKMRLTVPAVAKGGKSILGNDLYAEMIADGIDPVLVEQDVAEGFTFADRHEGENIPEGAFEPCEKDDDCDTARMWCGPKEGPNVRRGKSKKPKKDVERVCKPYIPVLASHHIVELYNGGLRRAHGFPKLNPNAAIGLTMDLDFGRSMVKGAREDEVQAERAQLVGFSDKAISVGVTMPIGYVKRLNSTYDGDEAATQYHSIIVKVRSKDEVGAVSHTVQEDLGFDVTDSGADQAAMLIAIFMIVFGLVSAIIVGIAAINIMHVFFMLIYERQREIGIMRAVGANRSDIRRIILGEAAIVGLIAGFAGLAVAMGMSMIFDYISAQYVPDFPYKPETYFEFGWGIVMGSLAFAVGACAIGAWLPATRAARMDPVVVLTSHGA